MVLFLYAIRASRKYGYAYVPVRWVAENLGKIVKYEHETKTISIENTNLSEKLVLDKVFLTFASEGKIKGILRNRGK
jgi:hypothetical protein